MMIAGVEARGVIILDLYGSADRGERCADSENESVGFIWEKEVKQRFSFF